MMQENLENVHIFFFMEKTGFISVEDENLKHFIIIFKLVFFNMKKVRLNQYLKWLNQYLKWSCFRFPKCGVTMNLNLPDSQ